MEYSNSKETNESRGLSQQSPIPITIQEALIIKRKLSCDYKSPISSIQSCDGDFQLRIMGILTSPIQKSTFVDPVNVKSARETIEGSCFLLDDGTAMIDVIVVGDDGSTRRDSYVKRDCLTGSDWKEGDLVDCIGTIKTIGVQKGDNVTGTETACKKEAMIELVPCLLLERISKVTDTNLEIFGMIQAASSKYNMIQTQIDNRRLHLQEEARLGTTRLESNDGYCCLLPPRDNGIYVYGAHTLQLPIGPFERQSSRLPSNSDHGTESLVTNTKYLFSLLKHAPPDGLSKEDLALLLGCDCEEEYRALENGLKLLQANCEIYQNKLERFLPL